MLKVRLVYLSDIIFKRSNQIFSYFADMKIDRSLHVWWVKVWLLMWKFAEFALKYLADINLILLQDTLFNIFWRGFHLLFSVVIRNHVINFPEIFGLLVNLSEVMENQAVLNDLFRILFSSEFES